MTISSDQAPWRGLSGRLADVLEPELPAVAEEIVRSIRAEVPEYSRPLVGAFGRNVRAGVTDALRGFIALVREPDAAAGAGRAASRTLGRGELSEGRTLDALQSAYRVGARVAWRRLSDVGHAAGVDPREMSLLAEAIFAFIDELSAAAVEGYAQAQSERAGEHQRRRRELLALLVADPPAGEAAVAPLARAAGWTMPATASAVACPEEALPGIARRLDVEALAAPVDGLGCIVLPDPAGPGRADALRAAVRGARAAAGPVGPVEDLPSSWRLARSALAVAPAGEGGLLLAEDRLAEIVVLESREAIERLGARRLAALAELTPAARDRLAATALAYVQHQGNAAAMARALHVHPQTARYRLARLRELLGEQLDDPDARFELELALRASAQADWGTA